MASAACAGTKDKAAGINIAANPIVNGTSDDPSTAWKTAHGEYRLIGNAKAYGQVANGKAPIYAATDFTGSWHLVGGECSCHLLSSTLSAWRWRGDRKPNYVYAGWGSSEISKETQ